jgi:1-acyl-sn-glycerol-3-phosphate acyltransferase
VAFGTVYLVYEVLAIIMLFVLWVGSGFGLWLRTPWMQAANYAFMRWWLGSIGLAATALFRLRISVLDGPDPRPGPLLVFARHGGPGNSLMLINVLLRRYGRRPRIVMLNKLQWDPVLDVIGCRLPNQFIDHNRARSDEYLAAITELASHLGDRDAVVIFPEGHDFTPKLRLRAIAHLWQKGFRREAQEAEELTNVLPPRHRGPMAAILAAPAADVAFVAHTVTEDLGSFGTLWRNLPLERPIRARYWRIAADEVPHADDQLIDWLYAWWEQIDDWIESHRATPAGSRKLPLQ